MNNKKMATRRLTINAVLIAIYVVLRYFNISFGEYFRFTLAAFSVVLCALLYGPVDGMLVGLLGEFLSQILGPYGLTPTTLFWCIGETARGATLGLCSMLFLKAILRSSDRPGKKQVALVLICCVLTGVLASLGQTFALYMDSKMMGYYTYAMVFGMLVWRVLTYVILSLVFGFLSLPIITALKKARFV